jgi:hypothetical protein
VEKYEYWWTPVAGGFIIADKETGDLVDVVHDEMTAARYPAVLNANQDYRFCEVA